ncbi:glycosyltransferase [Cellvibrio sp. PSBB006]|uniref:GumK N-terminal domain-containing glycosyltransferase n=1 Tax=Cellvibrio sp. PSBB006 TaxID=1987723 RepID=UPI000B3B1545|nr:glycosyltransferase [Cellvibrio sp. PSBB006]ARU27802.1 UDP-glucuronate--glycolipid 2-beta-glucuronosyltransferase [Cellvibrio sp. PSBB006]
MNSQAAVKEQPSTATDNFLVLSAHDYRSPRKASIHFITNELAKRGPTRFFSLRYSMLSRYTADPRLSLDDQANRIATHQGVECYLWKTMIHPFNTRRSWLRPAESIMYRWYSQGRNNVLRQWIKDATVILLESGVAPVFFDLIKQLNPSAKILYRASDSLEAINVAEYVNDAFARIAGDINTIALPSRALVDSIPSRHNLIFVPHGIDHSVAEKADPSPYEGEGIHAVSVGSMLFDPSFFVLASKRFPQIHFHVIGSGHPRHPEYGDNVTVYGEMPFAQTLRYIKHARIGIAPYSSTNLPAYLRDTSLKLIQYEFFKLPAICPTFIAADYPTRFGYEIGDGDSIEQAINRALSPVQPLVTRQVLSWGEVTERMLTPQFFRDTEMTA